MKGELLRWGICCAGKISNDFVVSLNALPKNEHKIIAVAARNIENAKAFAAKHSIPKASSAYKDLAADPEIDIVYVGAIHTGHFELSKMMLEAGKHVLCEKPLCVTVAQTKALFAIAKSQNRFLMEGLWSRFFPAYKKLKELLQAGVIGEITHLHAQFGEYSSVLPPRVREKDQAGGAVLDRGVYPIQFAQFVFDEAPLEVHAYGTLLKETGVDSQCHTFLRYSKDRTAVVSTSILANMANEGLISGTKGTIRVCFPLWCPTKLEVCLEFDKTETYEFSLPPVPKEKFVFRNSMGFMYEATEVRNCIVKGLTQCPTATPEMSIQIAEIISKSRRQIGYTFENDEDA